MDFIESVMGAVSGFHRVADELSEILIGTCLVYEHIVWYCCVAFHAGKCSLELRVVVNTSQIFARQLIALSLSTRAVNFYIETLAVHLLAKKFSHVLWSLVRLALGPEPASFAAMYMKDSMTKAVIYQC